MKEFKLETSEGVKITGTYIKKRDAFCIEANSESHGMSLCLNRKDFELLTTSMKNLLVFN